MTIHKKFDTIEKLRAASPVFPDFIITEEDNQYVVSSIVRVFRRGKWYLVHICTDDMIFKFVAYKIFFADLIKRHIKTCYEAQHVFELKGLSADQLDPFQGDEEARLNIPKSKS